MNRMGFLRSSWQTGSRLHQTEPLLSCGGDTRGGGRPSAQKVQHQIHCELWRRDAAAYSAGNNLSSAVLFCKNKTPFFLPCLDTSVLSGEEWAVVGGSAEEREERWMRMLLGNAAETICSHACLRAARCHTMTRSHPPQSRVSPLILASTFLTGPESSDFFFFLPGDLRTRRSAETL